MVSSVDAADRVPMPSRSKSCSSSFVALATPASAARNSDDSGPGKTLSRSQRGRVSAASIVVVVIARQSLSKCRRFRVGAWCRFGPLPLSRLLPFDVRELLGDLAIPNAENVDAADRAVAPGVAPADGAAIAAGESVLGRELRPWRSREERLPEGAHRRLPLMPLAVGWWRGVLEEDVVGHQRHHRVDVVPVEGVVEALDRGQRLGGRGIHLRLLANEGRLFA